MPLHVQYPVSLLSITVLQTIRFAAATLNDETDYIDRPELRAMPDILRVLGKQLLSKADGSLIATADALQGASAIGFYFSASWCPPCRGFTPLLIDSYKQHLHPKGLRCVLVSWDRDDTSFTDYYSSMPWLALPYEESSRNQELCQHFAVRTIPTLALVDPEGNTITTGAREALVDDPQGEHYPWTEPAGRDFAVSDPKRLNDSPSVICICEAHEASQAAEALETAGGDYGLFVGCGGSLTKQLNKLCGLKPSGVPRLLMINLPDNGSFYIGPEGPEVLQSDVVAAFVADFAAGRLTRHEVMSPSE